MTVWHNKEQGGSFYGTPSYSSKDWKQDPAGKWHYIRGNAGGGGKHASSRLWTCVGCRSTNHSKNACSTCGMRRSWAEMATGQSQPSTLQPPPAPTVTQNPVSAKLGQVAEKLHQNIVTQSDPNPAATNTPPGQADGGAQTNNGTGQQQDRAAIQASIKSIENAIAALSGDEFSEHRSVLQGQIEAKKKSLIAAKPIGQKLGNTLAQRAKERRQYKAGCARGRKGAGRHAALAFQIDPAHCEDSSKGRFGRKIEKGWQTTLPSGRSDTFHVFSVGRKAAPETEDYRLLWPYKEREGARSRGVAPQVNAATTLEWIGNHWAEQGCGWKTAPQWGGGAWSNSQWNSTKATATNGPQRSCAGDSLPAKTDATRHNRNVKVALVSANVRTLLPWQEDRSYAQNSLCLMRSKVEALEVQFEAARYDLVGIQEGRAKTTAALDGVHFKMLTVAADQTGTGGNQLWIRHSLNATLVTWRDVGPRIMYAIVELPNHHVVAAVVFHAHHMGAKDAVKDSLYEDLWRTVGEIREKFPYASLRMLADANGRVGSSLSAAVGDYEKEKENDGGLRIRTLCEHFHLSLYNSFFSAGPTWASTRSTWHRIDYVAGDAVDLKDVSSCYVDYDVDLSLNASIDHCPVVARQTFGARDESKEIVKMKPFWIRF